MHVLIFKLEIFIIVYLQVVFRSSRTVLFLTFVLIHSRCFQDPHAMFCLVITDLHDFLFSNVCFGHEKVEVLSKARHYCYLAKVVLNLKNFYKMKNICKFKGFFVVADFEHLIEKLSTDEYMKFKCEI